MKLLCETSSLFELGIIKNAAILRDFLNLLTWQQRQTQSTSARLPQFSKLTISKTKQFCEASFGNGLPHKTTSERPKAFRTCVFLALWLGNVLRATTACTFSTCHVPEALCGWGVLYILSSKCASRHNGVHFFNISTSKSVPRMVCFVHFDFETRFAPQRRALFRHLNFQKRSGTEVLCKFWLGNVLRATTACTFSTSQLPKVVRRWCVLYILTWTCHSRHNGVQFVISHLARWLRTRRFKRAYFSTLRSRKSLEKTQWTATFLPFRAPASSFFFLLTLSLLFSSLLLSSPLLSSPLFSSLLLSSPLFSSLLLSSPLFPSLLFPSLLFSSLLVSSLLVSSRLFASLLFSGSSHLCFFTCLYCGKFGF